MKQAYRRGLLVGCALRPQRRVTVFSNADRSVLRGSGGRDERSTILASIIIASSMLKRSVPISTVTSVCLL